MVPLVAQQPNCNGSNGRKTRTVGFPLESRAKHGGAGSGRIGNWAEISTSTCMLRSGSGSSTSFRRGIGVGGAAGGNIVVVARDGDRARRALRVLHVAVVAMRRYVQFRGASAVQLTGVCRWRRGTRRLV